MENYVVGFHTTTRQIVMLGKLGGAGVSTTSSTLFAHISLSRVWAKRVILNDSQLCFGLSEHLEKKRHFGEKKLVPIIVSSTLLVVRMTIVALVSYIWKKKLKTQGRNSKPKYAFHKEHIWG
jgi:uncharacterized membrane protein